MKKRISIGFSSMDGFGPKAWDRDESTLNIHTPRPHHAKEHPNEHADKGEEAATDQNAAAAPRKEE